MNLYKTPAQEQEERKRIAKFLFVMMDIYVHMDELKTKTHEQRLEFVDQLCEGDLVLMFMVGCELFRMVGKTEFPNE